jgi:hypothetical protein
MPSPGSACSNGPKWMTISRADLAGLTEDVHWWGNFGDSLTITVQSMAMFPFAPLENRALRDSGVCLVRGEGENR